MSCPRIMGSRRLDAQKGSATITALIVVGVAAVLISGLVWRQEMQIRTLENVRDRTQAAWLQRAIIDFARLVLVEDQRNSRIDHLGETWALPLADTKVADFLKNADVPDEISGVTVLGRLTDAQGLFNLTNLWDKDFKTINASGVRAYGHLLDALGLDRNLAQQTAQVFLEQGFPLNDVDSLSRFPVYTPSMLRQLSPYLTVLPTTTAINVNTAPLEVLMAAIPSLSRTTAAAFVQQRSLTPVKSIDEVAGLLSKLGVVQSETPDAALVDVKSQFWLARTEIRLGRGIFSNLALIQRSSAPLPSGDLTQVIWNHGARMLSE